MESARMAHGWSHSFAWSKSLELRGVARPDWVLVCRNSSEFGRTWPCEADRLRFRRLQQARETFRAMIRCLHRDDNGAQACGTRTESFHRPHQLACTTPRNGSSPAPASQGQSKLKPRS